jgi:hypothetical protein
MDELKLLIEMVANLPSLAVWVLVGYLVYKVAIVGSVYGVIRLAIIKIHDWKVTPVVVQMKLGAQPLGEGTIDALNAQIVRLAGPSGYIHMSDVQKLREALDAKLKP